VLPDTVQNQFYLIHGPRGLWAAPIGLNISTSTSMGKIFENLFKKPLSQKKVQIYLQGDLIAIKKSNFVCVYMRNISQYNSGERCGPWASCFTILVKNGIHGYHNQTSGFPPSWMGIKEIFECFSSQIFAPPTGDQQMGKGISMSMHSPLPCLHKKW
jgi:hypothetical protein